MESGLSKRELLALQVIDLARAEILLKNHFLAGAVGRLTADPVSLGDAEDVAAAADSTADEIGKQGRRTHAGSSQRKARNGAPFITNGEQLGFDANNIITAFRKSDGKAPAHDLLHVVAHCLFLHPFIGRVIDHDTWDLACDMAAEQMVLELMGPREDPRGSQIKRVLDRVESDLGGRITAEKVYSALCQGSWSELRWMWAQIFRVDDHIAWYAPPDIHEELGEGDAEKGSPFDKANLRGPEPGSDERRAAKSKPKDAEMREGEQPPNQSDDSDQNQDQPEKDSDQEDQDDAGMKAGDKKADEGQKADQSPSDAGIHRNEDATDPGDKSSEAPVEARSQGHGAGRDKEPYVSKRAGLQLEEERGPRAKTDAEIAALKDEWKDVALSLEIDLETYSREAATALSDFVGDLTDAARRRVDYRDFLRKFAALGEVMRLSEDEFDNVFYTYGMRMFGNLPLIEPVESREEHRVREFVIVIDTSGSVRGQIVRAFVDTTFDVLKSVESFHEKVNLRIIQCDEVVQSDDHITSMDQLRDWHRAMRLFGGGGTDFRPAFRYVDDLIDAGAFENLGGLVYFTDGWGTYPEWMPTYKTAFVFYDENHKPQDVPAWAYTAVLDSKDIGAQEQASGQASWARDGMTRRRA